MTATIYAHPTLLERVLERKGTRLPAGYEARVYHGKVVLVPRPHSLQQPTTGERQ